jgi:hypothetical protein
VPHESIQRLQTVKHCLKRKLEALTVQGLEEARLVRRLAGGTSLGEDLAVRNVANLGRGANVELADNLFDFREAAVGEDETYEITG